MRAVVATSTGFHLRHLAQQLLRQGWDVEFHSYLPRWKTRQYGLPDSATVSHFNALLPLSAVALVRFDHPWLTTLRQHLAAAVDRRIARTMQPADVFVGLSNVSVACAARAREQGALVLVERGSSHIRQQRAAALAAGMRPPRADYVAREEASYAAADRVVLLSDYARKSFVENGFPDERIAVMAPGVDLARFAPPAAPPALPVKALVVGVWSRRKGCDLIGDLLDELPNLTVTHAGSIGDAPVPASPRFTSLGHCDHRVLAQVMQQHHLLLFPSRDDGFGMVMAEALASGLRVVASTACGGPELARLIGKRYVALIDPGSFDQLVTQTRSQIADITMNFALTGAPTERIAELTWDSYGERYVAMLERLLEDRDA